MCISACPTRLTCLLSGLDQAEGKICRGTTYRQAMQTWKQTPARFSYQNDPVFYSIYKSGWCVRLSSDTTVSGIAEHTVLKEEAPTMPQLNVVNLTNTPATFLVPGAAPIHIPVSPRAMTLTITKQRERTESGIPVFIEKHPNQSSLPSVTPGVYYLVDEPTYRAAYFRKDFVYLGEALTDSDGTIWGYKNLVGHHTRN